MSTVPYIFASASGNIPLGQLDANFSNVKAQVDSANVVSDAAQPAITSVGTLTSLTVSGNIDATQIKNNNYVNILSGYYSQLQWATDINTPDVNENNYVWVDANGAYIQAYSNSYNYLWSFNIDGSTSFPGNITVTGNAAVSSKLAVGGNLEVTGITKVGSYVKATLNTITGTAGSMVAVLDSPTHQGRIAYWDLTYNRWSYVDTNGPV